MCETERQAKMELIEFDRFTEQDDCDKYNMLQQSACEIRALENKNQLLEKRINKAIEHINFILAQAYSRGSTDVDTIHLAHTASLLRGASDE